MTSAESRRRHQRIETPLDVVIDGTVVRVLDWSLGGFAVPVDSLGSKEVGEAFDLEACFDLGAAVIATRLRAKVARRQPDRIGCQFLDLSDEALGILRQIHSAQRAGRPLRADAVTATAVRSGPRPNQPGGTAPDPALATASAPPVTPPQHGLARHSLDRLVDLIRGLRRRMRLQALLAFSLVGLLGLGLGLYAVIMMLTPIEAQFAALNLPGTVVRAPSDGVVEQVLAQPGDDVSTQTALVRFRPQGAGTSPGPSPGPSGGGQGMFLSSPCRCSVSGVQVHTGQSVTVGAPLIRLSSLSGGLASGGPAMVESLVSWDKAALFTPGTFVAVRLAGIPERLSGQVQAPSFTPVSALPSVVTDAARGNLVTVYVHLDHLPKPANAPLLNGQPARVRLERSPVQLLRRLIQG